jgi:hypothetical protein
MSSLSARVISGGMGQLHFFFADGWALFLNDFWASSYKG